MFSLPDGNIVDFIDLNVYISHVHTSHVLKDDELRSRTSSVCQDLEFLVFDKKKYYWIKAMGFLSPIFPLLLPVVKWNMLLQNVGSS